MALYEDKVHQNSIVIARNCNLCKKSLFYVDDIFYHVSKDHTDKEILSYIFTLPKNKINQILEGSY